MVGFQADDADDADGGAGVIAIGGTLFKVASSLRNASSAA